MIVMLADYDPPSDAILDLCLRSPTPFTDNCILLHSTRRFHHDFNTKANNSYANSTR
jgi:hypothetical protein